MPLHIKLQEKFQNARADYVGSFKTPAEKLTAQQTFDTFYNTVLASSAHVSLLNNAFTSGILEKVKFFPPHPSKNPAGRSGFASNSWDRVGGNTLKSFRLKTDKKGLKVRVEDGTLALGLDLIESPSINPTGTKNSSGFTEGQARSLFIIAHEIGHGLGAAYVAPKVVNAVNDLLAHVTAQGPNATSINVQAQVTNFVNARMQGEGVASLYAYNTWIQGHIDAGVPLASITDEMRRTGFGNYAAYLVELHPNGAPKGQLLIGLQTDAEGKIIVNDHNLQLLGARNAERQLANPNVKSHVIQYTVEGLAYAAAHKSDAAIEFDGVALGLSSTTPGASFTVEQALNTMGVHFFKGEHELRDISPGGLKYKIDSKTTGSKAAVSILAIPADGSPPTTPMEAFMTVGNFDGNQLHDSTLLHFVRGNDGSLTVKVRDAEGNEITLSAAEFELTFGMSAEDGFAQAAGQASEDDRVISAAVITVVGGEKHVEVAKRKILVPGGVRLTATPGGVVPTDYLDRKVTYVYSGNRIVAYTVTEKNVTVVTTLNEQLKPVATDIKLNNNPIGIEFSDAGAILGQQLGSLIAGKNRVAGVVSSAALKTIGDNLGDVVDGLVGKQSATHATRDAFKTFGPEFLNNLKSAGVGAVSSYLTAELLRALDINGFAGELANATGGVVISQIASNLTDLALGVKFAADGSKLTAFSNVGPAMVVSAAASFIGSKLATEIKSFNSVGGQIGAAVGSAVASFIDGPMLMAAVMSGNPVVIGVAVVVAVLDQILLSLIGGAIGSIFGGTPRSGADVEWDSGKGEFVVANLYSRKGGSKDAAEGMAASVAAMYNSVLVSIGGELLDPNAVQAGNYGMRSKDFVYRPVSSREKSEITKRFKGEAGSQKLINYGVYEGLNDPDFKIAGGDIYLKRALYNTLDDPSLSGENMDSSILAANFAAAERYKTYLANPTLINSLIAAERDSVFAAEWAITFARAVELGLTRRHESDWYGGFTYLLDEAKSSAAEVAFDFDYDPDTDKISRMIMLGDSTYGDPIDVAAQTVIEGSDGVDLIRLSGDRLVASSAGSNANLLVNGEAYDGLGLTIDVAATIDAGDGNDEVHASDLGDNVMGGAGGDTLYGGKLDDWLIGGEGNDFLHAGAQSAGTGVGDPLGGDGNYLDGGDGDDHLYGREGSDWLSGGDGEDEIDGGDGDDILAGGGGDGDTLKGGRGNDQYIVHVGDGIDDVVDEAATATVVRETRRGAVNWLGDRSDLLAAIAANALAIEEQRTERFTAAVSTDGDDAIVFGAGIEMGDLALKQSGNDLMIRVTAGGSVSEVAVKDWFTNPVKRIEWLKFADGNEIRIADTTNFIVGTSGNDTIIGTEYADFVAAGAGDDKVWLLGGPDFGSGGTGDDMVFGGTERDIIVGGLGRDTLHGEGDDDMLSGDAGGDEIDGGGGNDIVSGGHGDDLLKGGLGNDVFKFSRGDGRDTILQEEVVAPLDEALWKPMTNSVTGQFNDGYSYDHRSGELRVNGVALREDVNYDDGGSVGWNVPVRYRNNVLEYYSGTVSSSIGASGSDRISFEVGINVQDLVFDTSGLDLIIGVGREDDMGGTAAGAADRIVIRNWNGEGAPGNRPVKGLEFYQTGTIDLGDGGKVLTGGTAGDDSRSGGDQQDWITGAAGRDTLTGGGSDDILSGGGDDDRLEGQAGSDVLYGGAGQDVLLGGGEDDVLSGGDGNDLLEGGSGADLIAGGAGEDTASYASSNASTGVAVSLAGASATRGDAVGDMFEEVENLTGSAGHDELGGDGLDNELTGGLGNDVLRAEAGDDTYIWSRGDGNDTIEEGIVAFEEAMTAEGALLGGFLPAISHRTEDYSGYMEHWHTLEIRKGSETVYSYSFVGPNPYNTTELDAWPTDGWLGSYRATGVGSQAVMNSLSTASDAGSDILELGEKISLSHLSFEAAGADLIIHVAPDETGAGAGQIRIRNHYTTGGKVETLQFHDGASVSLKSFEIGRSVGLEGVVDDLLIGSDGSDVLRGEAGNDAFFGGAGLNELRGGSGDDLFEAGTGKDMYFGEAGAEDTVRFVASAAAVNVNLGTGTGAGGSADTDTFSEIENVTGSAHGDILTGNQFDNELIGLGGDNILTGNDGNDVLTALGGNDTLNGGEGEDALSGGDGTDTLIGGGGKDFLDGGAGGGTLDGGIGDDQIVGGSGVDTIRGGEGADILNGRGGGDTLQGDQGDDQYVFEPGTGTDTITDGSGKNGIHFGGGIDRSQLWLTQDGNTLRIGVIGSDHIVRVEGFFATTGAVSRIHSVQAGEYTLFLNGTKGQDLIDLMTAANLGAAPGAMNATIGADLDSYWSKGNAAPEGVAQTAAGSITVVEGTDDVVVAGAAPAFVATDPEGDPISWSMVEDAGGRFAIDPLTGTLTVRDAARIDFETAQSHALTIRAADSSGNYTDHSVTVTVTNASATPHLEAGSGTVLERSTGWYARFGLHDQDDVPAIHLVDDAGGRFTIVNALEVRFAAGSAPDFEDLIRLGYTAVDTDGDGLGEISISGTVRATSTSGVPGDAVVTAVIKDENEIPTDMVLDGKVAEIAERDRLATDSGPGASNDQRPALTLGTVRVVDNDHASQKTGKYTYQVFENGSTLASERFAVVEGELRLLVDKSLDYETDGASISLRVAARDGLSANPIDRTFTFAIGDKIDVYGGNDGDNDPLNGQSGQDLILGYGGNDVLVGGTGADTLDGGLGADIAGYAGATGPIAADLELKTVQADGVTDTLISIEGVRGSAFADDLRGSSGADVLEGGAGNDLLDGRAGADRMEGGTGADVYFVDDAGDLVKEDANQGIDEVRTGLASYQLADNVENLTGLSTTIVQHLKDNSLNNTITGTSVTDILYLNAGGNDTLYGKEGSDSFIAGGALTASDRLDGGAGTDTILFHGNSTIVLSTDFAVNIENLTFRPGSDTLYGPGGLYSYNITVTDSMVLVGAEMRVNGSVLLEGETLIFDGSAETDGSFYVFAGLGRDDIKGGDKDDILHVVESRFQPNDRFDGGDGSDQVQFRGSTSLTFGTNALSSVETLKLISGSGYGTIFSHNITLSDGNVALGQTLTVDGSTLLGTEGFTLDGKAELDGKLVLKGGAGNDVLTGGSGSDMLEGGAGADTLKGRSGDDTYVVDHAADSVTEDLSQGTDSVRTSLSTYALGANVENLAYTGSAAFTGTGNLLANTITGGTGNDLLTGGAGGDTLDGGAGIDTASYAASALGITVDLTTNVNTGGDAQNDLLTSIENVIGSDKDDVLTGSAAANSLQGGLGNDRMRGAAGADLIDGGSGTDTADYAGDSGGAIVNLSAAAVIVAGTSIAAGTARDGTGAIDTLVAVENVRGSSFGDMIYGNAGDNLLDGGAGTDALFGGAGNDVFLVDNTADIVTEAAGQGDDEVRASAVAYTLRADVEKLTGTSVSGQSLTGNAGVNIITGNDGNDTIDGGLGGDSMRGGKGNDTYVVDDALDSVTELAGEGTADHVRTTLRTYTLGQELENLTSTAVGGTTTLTGNSADNVVTTGSAGDFVILLTGGKDNVSTGDGDDGVLFSGSDFNEFDRIDLGAGTRDELVLRGSLTTTFRAWHLAGAEYLSILSGMDSRWGVAPTDRVLAHYNLTTIDENVVAGTMLTVDSAQTITGETVRFDGRAEKNGSFFIYGGAGTDTFFGGDGNDTFAFTGTPRYNADDVVDGGAGNDTLQLRNSFTVAFASGAMTSIEKLELLSGVSRGTVYNYNITMNDANVVAGALLTVDSATLAATEILNFDGSAETNERFLITGGAGNDVVRGGAGIDTINTGAGNDLIHLRAVGEDIVDGGAGTDKVSFGDLATKVVVNLATDSKLVSVEQVVGGSAGDELTGSDLANLLDGGAGNDTLQGGKGADALIGGDHVVIVTESKEFGSRGGDIVSYSNSGLASQTEVMTIGGLGVDDDGNGTVDRQVLAARTVILNGVRVSLADNAIGSASTATGADAAGDQFTGIENLLGSASNDQLRGTNNASDVAGGAGDDLIYGGAGDDRLYGGANDDVLYGQAGKDELYGGDGNDRLFGEEVGDDLTGGAGHDVLVGGAGNDVYIFGRGDGNDRIFNYDPTGAFDQLSMSDDILFDNLWFERVDKNGNASATGIDLRITVLGQTGHDGTVTIDDWFKSGVSPGLFQLDMITDSNDRATVPADIDELIAVMGLKTRPPSQVEMNQYLTAADFRAGVDGGWQKLTKPVLVDVLDFITNEPLDGADPKVTFKVKVYYENAPGQNLSIPNEQIELKLVGANGALPTDYVTKFEDGIVGSDGYRTVTLTLTPNGSTHLLANGSLPLTMTARLRGVADTKGTLTARDDFKLTILQTADTPTLTGSSAGGNVGTYIPIVLATDTPDKDGSEKVDVRIANLPAGYLLTNAAGTAVGTWQGYDPSAKALTLVDAGKTSVTALAGGTYRIAKTGTNQLDASAVSTTAMAGDFILRAKSILNESFSVVGMNFDPRTDHNFMSMDFGIGWQNGAPGIIENGVHTANFTANGDLWMWRKGTTVYFGTGPDFQTASTTGVVRSAANVTSALHFDSAFGVNNNTVEVQVVEVATKVNAADVSGLRLFAPAGRSDDASLNITPVSVDGPSTRPGAAYTVKVTVNAAPSDIATRGAGTAPGLNISESTPTNNPINKVVGIATAIDPDALDRNLVSTDFTQLGRFGVGEEQVAYAAGPDGKVVQILESGQKTGGAAGWGGGVTNGLSEALDPGKAYRFSVYVKMDNSFAHSVWFGTLGTLENAVTGAAATQGYGAFVESGPSALQSGRWYRLEGYVLPVGHEMLASQDLMGGIFDAATGVKVANANTFRFASGAQTASIHFFTFGNEQNQGFSTQWHQPQVEKLEYRYELVGTNPLFKVNPVSGAIVATSNAIDFESAQSHNVTVRVIDRSTNPTVDPVGLVKDKVVTIAVNNLNEPNSFPATPPGPMGVDENSAGAIVGTVQATDIDSSSTPFGQQTYGFWNPGAGTFAASSSDGRYVIDSVTGQIRTASALNYETMSAPVSYWVAARDNNGVGQYFQAEMQISIGVRDLNEPNSLPASYGMNVNENVALGTAVGTVAATDLDLASTANGQQRYYFYNSGAVSSVSSDSRYSIDALTGQIKTNAALNFEAGNTSAAYTIVARDNQGAAGTGAIYRSSFEELAVPTIGHRPDGGNSAMLRVTNSPSQGNGALRAAMAGSHTWTFQDSSFVAAQSTVTLSVMVRDSGVTNASIAGGWSGSTADAAHPVLLGLHNATTGAWSTATNATATKPPNGGAWVRHVQTITGLTVGQTYTVSAMMGAYDGARASDIDALQVEYGSVATPFVGWSQAFTTATIGINDVNEANSLPASYAMSVNENVAVGTAVGTVAATDIEPASVPFGQQRYYFLNSGVASATSSDGRYAIDAVTGTIRTAAGLNRETMSAPVAYSVIARDNLGTGNQAATSVTIGVNDLNEANGFAGSYSLSVAENVAMGTQVGTVAASDQDSSAVAFGQQRYYFWNGSAAISTSTDGRYSIDAVTGAIRTAAALDHETMSAPAGYTVVARDNAGASPYLQASTAVTIGISNVNETPSGLILQSQTIHSETLPGDVGHPGKTIASFAMSDPDGAAPSLAIIGGNGNGWFTTSGGNLNFAGANFTSDWLRGTLGQYGQESGWYHDNDGDGLKEVKVASLTLAAVDAGALQGSPLTYNVFIEDKNEAPVWNAVPYTFGVNENTEGYTYLGTVAGSDVDGPAGDLRYGFADWSIYYDGNIGNVSRSPDGRFLINSHNGAVYVNAGQALEYESANRSFSYSTRVYDRAAGPHALSTLGTLNINVQNTNDSATWYTQVPVGFTVNENLAVGTIVSNGVRATDSDGYGISYSIDQATNPNGAFGVNASGQIYVAGAIDYESANWLVETGGKYANLRVLASDGGAAAAETIKINIGNVRKYVYNNGALDNNLYEMRHQSTYMGGGDGGEYGYTGRTPIGGGGGYGSSWYNEAWVVEKSTGLVLSWMGEYSQWENTTSRPFPHAANVASGYVASGTYPNPYTMYADKEDIMSGIDGVPQGQAFYPIVFDLGGDGFDLVGIKESGVTTDLNKDGIVEGSGWLKASDGLLALDRNGDGLVLDWNEISFVKDRAGALTDLEGLVAFDSNGDFKLAAGDARFDEFRLWVDSNQDGIGQAGELRSLEDAGIVSVSLARENIQPASGSITVNSVLATAAFERSDGTAGRVGDIALGRLPQRGPDAEPGAPKFRFDELGAAGSTAKSEAGAPSALDNEGKTEMNIPQAVAAQRTAAAVAGETEAQQPSAQSAQAQADLVPQAAELAARSFAGGKDRYSLAVSGGSLFVTGNKPEGAVDSRVQEVRSGSLLSFRNGIVGLVAPVVLDLDGDGVELKRRGKSDARFDMDGNGTRDDTGWISRQDGFLVVDLDGDGRITSPAELSLLGLKADARSGLDALASLDSDKNGSIDAKDARFGELKLWVDSNGNGITDAGELQSLADRGIASVGLAARAVADSTVKIGRNAMMATSTFTRTDGSIGSVGDSALAFRAGKSTGGTEAALRQIAADAGSTAAAGAEDRDRTLGDKLESLRAGLNSRPFLSLAAEGDSVFDRFDRTPVAAARESSLRRMDVPAMQVPVQEGESAQAEAATAAPAAIAAAADDLRLAKMVQDMASFGLRSGEGEWKNRGQTAQNFDYFA